VLTLTLLPILYLTILAIVDALTLQRKPSIELTGQCSDWRMRNESVTPAMITALLNIWRPNLSKVEYAKLETGATAPLMGWGYAYQFRDYAPPIELSLSMPGESYTMRAFNGNPALIVEALKVIKTSEKQARMDIANPIKAQARISRIPTKPRTSIKRSYATA
jgi:hypothetical protein